MIVRLYPKIDINKIWDYVENEIKEKSLKSITPLYATQTEGMMDVGIIFDVKNPDDLTHFITEEIVKCPEVHHTKTISLMKPVFFHIPKKKPENIQRYLIRIYTHPRYYKQVYENLINYNYEFNIFPIYISYSLGDEDIIMNIAADSKETAIKFLKEYIWMLNGVNQAALYPVFRAKRFASFDKLIEQTMKHLSEPARKMHMNDVDMEFDWIEDFEQYAMVTGAFPSDL
jgi:hypothetical protein